MKKIIFFLFFVLIFNTSHANTKVINSLHAGSKLVFIRHALAPGVGDPENFNIKDCLTQRNLSLAGVAQAKRIGQFFKDNNIPIDQVFSSEWCRCKDTAKNAFGNYKTFKALNSYFSSRFLKNRDNQMKDLKAFAKNWDSKKNIVFVTHYVLISEIFNENVNSGTIIVADRNFKVIGMLETN